MGFLKNGNSDNNLALVNFLIFDFIVFGNKVAGNKPFYG